MKSEIFLEHPLLAAGYSAVKTRNMSDGTHVSLETLTLKPLSLTLFDVCCKSERSRLV